MDQHLRQLERQALSGDREARIALRRARLRNGACSHEGGLFANVTISTDYIVSGSVMCTGCKAYKDVKFKANVFYFVELLAIELAVDPTGDLIMRVCTSENGATMIEKVIPFSD